MIKTNWWLKSVAETERLIRTVQDQRLQTRNYQALAILCSVAQT